MKALVGQEITTSKLFNFRPMLFAAISFCLGITFSYLYLFYGVSAWWSLGVIPLSGMPFLFCRSRRQVLQRIRAVLMLLCVFFFGLFSFSSRIDNYQDCTHYNGTYYVVGKVTNVSYHGELAIVTLDDLSIGENHPKGKLIAYLPASVCGEFALADKILLHGKVKTSVECMREEQFRVAEIGDNVSYSCSSITSTQKVGQAFDPFAMARNRIQERIYAGMDEEPASVTVAVLTGNSSGMDRGLLTNMRSGGIAHIFAVSGLHVGALFGFCVGVLKCKPFRGIPSGVSFLLLAILLFVYAGICGFSPSIVRAAVICLIAYGAKLLIVGTDFLESLGISALLILCFQPTALFEVGFQLSFLSCLGIALLARPIQTTLNGVCTKVRGLFPARKLTRAQIKMLKNGNTLPPSIPERIVRAVVSFVAMSLAAQIATAPLQMHVFGYFSPLALLLNCIFVPMLTCAFGVILVCVVVAAILPIGAAGWILGVPSMLWSGILLLFEYVDFSKFVISGWRVPIGAFVGYYVGCTFLSDKWNLQKRAKQGIAFVCALTCIICLLVSNIRL